MTGLNFEFRNIESGQVQQTTFALSVTLDNRAIWPVREIMDAAIDIQIDDLLSHLTEFWMPLMLRQTYPFALNPNRPSQLRAEAEKVWAELPEQQVEAQDEILEQFQDCHDLSRCFAGYFDLPPLWLFRSGDNVLIDTGNQVDRVNYQAVMKALQVAGGWIAERLTGDRWSNLRDAWNRRDVGDGPRLLHWSTSLDVETLKKLAADGLLSYPGSVTEAANDDDELRIAARMSSALSSDIVYEVLSRVKQFARTDAPALEKLRDFVHSELVQNFSDAPPFEQGLAIADLVRQKIGLEQIAYVDIFSIIKDIGISISTEKFGPPTLDAIAVWGGNHGPATLINSGSQRLEFRQDSIEDQGQARVTLAHELCHFLVDKEHALAAVDVLRSRMPVAIEQRARAFAAEFLLPSQAAGQAWLEAGKPMHRDEMVKILDSLCKKYKVSKSVASWKIQHGVSGLGGDVASILDSIVPQR